MAYLDPMRFTLSGDRSRAQSHIRTARVAALSLTRQNLEGGAGMGRRRVVIGDGTVIDIQLAGLEMSATIRSPSGGEVQDIILAFVAHNGMVPPTISVVDVNIEKVLYTFSGLGSIVAMHADPKGRFIYTVNTAGILVKFDVHARTAIGVDTSLSVFATDMLIDPEGTTLYVRYRATGGLGFTQDVYGGVLRFATEDLSFITAYPNQLFGTVSDRGGSVHPNGQLYLLVYGDGNGDTELPDTGFDQHLTAIESYTDTAFVAGEMFTAPYLASGSGFRSAEINKKGTRLYAASTASARYFENAPSNEDVPTFLVYDVEDGGLTRIASLMVGEKLTGSLGINHAGTVAFVVYRDTGEVQTILLGNDAFTLGPTFSMRPSETVGGESSSAAGRGRIHSGPRNGIKPDDRMYFVSVANTLWAFKPGALKPDKKIAFEFTVHATALIRVGARKIR